MTEIRGVSFSDLPDEALLRFSEFESLIPLGKSAWWSGVAEGTFPAPVKLGRTSAWRVRDIRRLLNEGTPQKAADKRRRAS
jgi:predicted DNA-binding transcriptional regulator AlpA